MPGRVSRPAPRACRRPHLPSREGHDGSRTSPHPRAPRLQSTSGELSIHPAGRNALVSLLLVLSLLSSPAAAREPAWNPIGPEGGNVRVLTADPREPKRLYLGTSDGMLYRSDDGGRHWVRPSPGFPTRGVSLDQIVVDDRGAVIVGWWEVSGSRGGVARSEDGGRTFTTFRGLGDAPVRALALAPGDSRSVAAGTPGGVFLSRDGGRTWERISPEKSADLHDVASLAFDAEDPNVLYAGTRHLAWKTEDGGTTWRAIHDGMKNDSHVMTMNPNPFLRDDVFATACTGIYHSLDGGATWKRLGGIPDSSRRTRAFRRSADDPDLLLAGTTQGLWISEDAGERWRCATAKDLVVNAVVLSPDGTILLGTEEEGVLRSDDAGHTWTGSNAGFAERFVTSVAFDGDRVFAGVLDARPQGGVYVAPGVAGPWRRFGAGLAGRQVLSLAVLGDHLFAGTDAGTFVRATNGDGHWMRVDGGKRGLRVNDLLAMKSDVLLAATSDGLRRTLDGGRTWTPAAPDHGAVALALAASPAEPQLVVAATTKGYFRSEDGGATWRTVSAPIDGATPHALAFVAGRHPVLLVTTSAGLFRSRDAGATWFAAGAGLARADLSGLVASADGRTVFVSDFAHGGVFQSGDAGATWRRMIETGLASDHVWMLALDPERPERLLAAARAGGLHGLGLLPVATGDPQAPAVAAPATLALPAAGAPAGAGARQP